LRIVYSQKSRKMNSNQKGKKPLKLTKNQRSILIGVILGDAHLETLNSGHTFRVNFSQSVAHKPYLDHLYYIFKDWVLTPPKYKASNNV